MEKLLTTSEVAKIIGVSPSTIVRECLAGKIVPDYIIKNGIRLFVKCTVKKYMDSRIIIRPTDVYGVDCPEKA